MKLLSISFLRTFAALIIINSHCGNLYPVSALAKGGALGNSLFFLMSGFLLYPLKLEFSKWIKKRYIRLYIPVFILGVLLLILGEIKLNLYSIFFGFVFPEHRWFICALIIMYPIYYFVIQRMKNIKAFIICSSFLMLLYAFIYIVFLDTSTYIVEIIGFHGIRFSYIFSFFLMLIGGFIHASSKSITDKLTQLSKSRLLIYVSTILSGLCYFAFLILMNMHPALCRYQFFETILCITTTLGIFITVIINEETLRSIKGKWFANIIKIGDYTLEIYLIQFLIIDFVQEHLNIFPLSVIVVFVATIAIGIVFNKLVRLINRRIAQ